jgi:MYXO-CTERM domain-containing protein
MRTRAWIGLGMLLLASCSSNKDFPQKYAEAICSKNWECCPASELADKVKSDCVNNNEFGIGALVGEIKESQRKGRAAYDESKANTCADALSAMTCDEFKQTGGNMTTCMSFVTAKVAEGGACTQDYECTTGNCQGANTADDPPVDGACAAAVSVAPIGATCSNIECVDGAYCDFTTSTCLASKGAGEACTSDSECINSCDTATNTCTCYSGCSVAGPTTTRGVVLSLLVLGAGLVVRRSRRRHR